MASLRNATTVLPHQGLDAGAYLVRFQDRSGRVAVARVVLP